MQAAFVELMPASVGLFPVASVVVRVLYAAHLEAGIAVGLYTVVVEVYEQLVVHAVEQFYIGHLCLEQGNINARNFFDGGVHKDGVAISEGDVFEVLCLEVGPVLEQGVPYGDLNSFTLYKIHCHCNGVVHGTDGTDNGHLAVIVEINESVNARGKFAVHILVCYLQGADVFEFYNGCSLSDSFLFVEFHRLLNALDKQEHKHQDDDWEYDVSENLFHIYA